MAASQALRNALTKAEQTNPGLTFELVKGIIRKLKICIEQKDQILISDT